MAKSSSIKSLVIILILISVGFFFYQQKNQSHARTHILKDFQELEQYWNQSDISEFLQKVHAADYIDNIPRLRRGLIKLRRGLGAIKMSPQPLFKFDTGHERAYVAANAVMTTERGLMKWQVVYDKNLTPIGFRVSGKKVPF